MMKKHLSRKSCLSLKKCARALLLFCMASSLFSQAQAANAWLDEIMTTKEKGNRIETNLTKKETGFFSEHGLILFYASTCPHCHTLAPILKAWADKEKAPVLALSFDNQPLDEFPRFLPATTEWVNVAFKGQSIQYPALFVVNPVTQALYPVSFGSMTEDALTARMNDLIPKITAYEKKGAL